MKVLIACEYSGIVRDAFIAKGHHAVSCDLLPTERPGPHYVGDVMDIIHRGWDMMIAHPPCTHLSVAGAQYWPDKQKDGRQENAIDFFMSLANASIQLIAIENPVGIMNSAYRKPDQIIHPHFFGDPFRKKTCLWLLGLPLLEATNMIYPTHSWCSSSLYGGGRKRSTLPIYKAFNTGKERSKTFQGIANAMADQWGDEEHLQRTYSKQQSLFQ